MQSDPVQNIFARAWSLLAGNPLIVVPGLVVGIGAGIIQSLVGPHAASPDALGGDGATVVGAGITTGLGTLAGAGISAAVGILAFLITQTYTTGMAGAAWQTGRTTLADGSASFREDAGRLLAAIILIAIVGIVVGVVTLGLGWFLVLFFAIYAVPAVVLDNYGAVAAFRLSATIAVRRVVSTILIIALLVVIGVVISLVVLPFAVIPFLGPIIISIVSQTVTAYATLVIVGEYLATRRAPDITAGPLI